MVKEDKLLQIQYKNKEVEEQCKSVKAARKLFGGDAALTTSIAFFN